MTEQPLGPGDVVRTPSGAHAEVLASYPAVGEALVQWTSGDRARFRFAHLQLIRRAGNAQDAGDDDPATPVAP